jgi:SAM-dependent methyltransferase
MTIFFIMSQKVDFDKYAEEYEKKLADDLQFFGEENGYFAEYKVKIVKNTLEKEPVNILEYGCGIGLNLRFFKEYFPSSKIYGCDISEKSIGIAAKDNPAVNLFHINDISLNSYRDFFDVIFISCVFHHIEPSLRMDTIRKINSLLKPGGELYIFEHNPFNPVTQKIVKDCPWDTDAILLKPAETRKLFQSAGMKVTDLKYTLFFPAQLKFLRPLEKILGALPLGGQYYVKGRKTGNGKREM